MHFRTLAPCGSWLQYDHALQPIQIEGKLSPNQVDYSYIQSRCRNNLRDSTALGGILDLLNVVGLIILLSVGLFVCLAFEESRDRSMDPVRHPS